MFQTESKYFFDGKREIIFHKNELVEMIASLHSLQTESDEEQQSMWLIEKRMKQLNKDVTYSLEMYGSAYAKWLLIMDIATYISCSYYDRTGEVNLSYEAAMEEYRKLDDATYLYIFLGMPALGFQLEDAEEWLKEPDKIDKKSLKIIGQYISEKDIRIFIRNISDLKNDLDALLSIYWEEIFQPIWGEIEKSIDKTIKSEKYECVRVGDCIRYISNLHNQIHVGKGQIFLKKDVQYVVNQEEIKKIHIFPSTFSGSELLMDKLGDSLIIYYNLNLKYISDEIEVPTDLSMTFKALGDDNRLKIVKLLWGAPATTQYLANVLGLAQSTVSAHLKMLKSAGILKNKTIKKYVYYEVDQSVLERLSPMLLEFIQKD